MALIPGAIFFTGLFLTTFFVSTCFTINAVFLSKKKGSSIRTFRAAILLQKTRVHSPLSLDIFYLLVLEEAEAEEFLDLDLIFVLAMTAAPPLDSGGGIRNDRSLSGKSTSRIWGKIQQLSILHVINLVLEFRLSLLLNFCTRLIFRSVPFEFVGEIIFKIN